MTPTRTTILSALAAAVATAIVAISAHAQRGDLIAFPTDYAKGELYGTLDRADLKQVRLLYVNNKAAIDAAKKGEPVPNGTVITMAQYAAQVDEKGEPVKGPDGRFVRTEKIVGYTVMEKQAGWGNDVPAEIRNGDWQYQAFLADRTPNPKAVLSACFKCHLPLDKQQDFLFTWSSLRGVMK